MDKFEAARWADAIKENLDEQDHDNKTEEEFRAIIQYLMIDENYFNKTDYKPALKKLILSLESLAWLHNCSNIQSQMG